MTNQSELEAGEWFNFRGVQAVDILGHTNNIVRLRYDDGAEDVVKLVNTAQLRTLHEILETRSHPAPPESAGTGRKAGSWVNLRGVTSCKEGPQTGSEARLLFLSYSDGAEDDGVLFSPVQAKEVTEKFPSAS